MTLGNVTPDKFKTRPIKLEIGDPLITESARLGEIEGVARGVYLFVSSLLRTRLLVSAS